MVSQGDAEDLSGVALKIYIYLLESDGAGPREVARELGINPSLAYYHLKKFEELGIVEKDPRGVYRVKKRVRVKGYLYIGGKLVPRLLIYGAFFTGLLIPEIVSLAVGMLEPSPGLFLAIVTSAVAASIFILEGVFALRILKKKD
ncbi:MAG TPA: winged helix-turn-helix domain-containing protein [Sulfolobales archaeon]|nr:winged helix-turn-helix domain-containing protein [Sulfolobales archaeon]